MQALVAHIDLDSFFVSVERLRNPALLGKPVIIGGYGERGVVASCSYEARKAGVHSAMPMVTARKLCPQAVIIGGDMAAYSHYSHVIRAMIEAEASAYEQASIDEFYIDLSGMGRFIDPYAWIAQLRQKLMKESGLPMSLGVAVNKTVAKIATGKAKPNGEYYVKPGEERSFLAPLPIEKLPYLGDKTAEKLHQLGIHTLADVQQCQEAHLVQWFGKHGQSIWQRAQGIDNRSIEPYNEHKSISKERTFDHDISDRAHLCALLKNMAERLAFKLRQHGQLTGCVAVKIRYPGFETHTRQITIPFTCHDRHIMDAAMQIFPVLHREGSPVRLIGLRLSNLIFGQEQLSLFDNYAKDHKLINALDAIKSKHGHSIVNRASGWFKDSNATRSATPNFFKPENDPE